MCEEALLLSRELCGLRRMLLGAGLPRIGLGVKISLPLVARLRSSVQLALPSRLCIGLPSDRGPFGLESLVRFRNALIGLGSHLFGVRDRSHFRSEALH